MNIGCIDLSWAPAGWALPGLCMIITLVGDLLDLPDWVTGISPYEHVPRMPTVDFAVRPELVMTGLTLTALAASWWRFARRDIG